MSHKIFLIEDNTTMLSLLRTLFNYEGYDVSQPEGEEDLDSIMGSIRKEKPDLILLDVHLQTVNGFELLRSIRDDEELHNILVIMTSGMDFCKRCKEEGADGFIQKPYMPEELIEKIRNIIDKQEPTK